MKNRYAILSILTILCPVSALAISSEMLARCEDGAADARVCAQMIRDLRNSDDSKPAAPVEGKRRRMKCYRYESAITRAGEDPFGNSYDAELVERVKTISVGDVPPKTYSYYLLIRRGNIYGCGAREESVNQLTSDQRIPTGSGAWTTYHWWNSNGAERPPTPTDRLTTFEIISVFADRRNPALRYVSASIDEVSRDPYVAGLDYDFSRRDYCAEIPGFVPNDSN